MNTVIISGNLVKEIKLESTKNGKPYLKNTIAVSEGWNTKYEKTYFINFETYSKDALLEFKNLKKGQLVELEGKLVVENFKGKDGNWVNITKIVVFKARAGEFNKKSDTTEVNKKPDTTYNGVSWENI